MSIYKGNSLIAGGSQALPLLCFMWSDHRLNHPSWLNSTTFSWQSGAVYQAAYAHLVLDIDGKTLQSETVAGTTIQFYLADDGHKICPASEESNVTAIYNATGVAWYYIIDTVNQKFKLPRSSHNKYTTSLSVVGTGKVLGLTNGSDTFALNSGATYARLTIGYNAGQNVASSGGYDAGYNVNWRIGVSKDPAYSGLTTKPIAQDTDQYKYLYFYVGNFTQTALENTAGLNTELFNGKVDTGHQVIAFQAPTSENNYTWYRKYADGWVEQGGYASVNENSTTTINLPIVMADTNYTALAQNNSLSTAQDTENGVGIQRTSTTQVKLFTHYINPNTISASWQVSGMAAN